MPGTLDRYNGFPGRAASAIPAFAAVKVAPGAMERGFCPATAGESVLGFNGPVAVSQGQVFTVREHGDMVEAVAGASLGCGPVGIGASGLVPVAAASGQIRVAVGEALSPADAAGEVFSLYVRPRQLSDGGAI